MPKFSYKALDARGQVKSGIVEAADKSAAETELQRTGVKVQQLDMVRVDNPNQTTVMKAIKPPNGGTRAPGSGAMRVAVPPPPTSGANRVTVPPPPPGSGPVRPRNFPSGEKGNGVDSGSTRPPATLSPTTPARPVGTPPTNLTSGSMIRPPGLATLAPEAPVEAAAPVAPASEPVPASAPVRAVPREPLNLFRPLIALLMVAVGLGYLVVAAFTNTAPAPAPVQPTEAQTGSTSSVPALTTITLSGQLPKLPPSTTVVFHFSVGPDVERSLDSLELGPDGKFAIRLEVEQTPETFQVRARRPGQKDLVSSVCPVKQAQGVMTGTLVAAKSKVANRQN